MLFLEMYEVLVVVADENQSRVFHSLLQKILNLFGKYWPGRMLMDIRLFLYLSLDDLLSHRPHQNSPAPAAVFVWTTDLDSSHQKQIFPVSSSSVQSWGCRRRPWHKLSFFVKYFFPQRSSSSRHCSVAAATLIIRQNVFGFWYFLNLPLGLAIVVLYCCYNVLLYVEQIS